MLRKPLRAYIVAVTAMVALLGLSIPVASTPLTQSGARPMLKAASEGKIEPVAHRRKCMSGGYLVIRGDNKYWEFNRSGWSRHTRFAAGAAVGCKSSRVQWCANRYGSYDPQSDTYVGYDGYRHRCRAPY